MIAELAKGLPRLSMASAIERLLGGLAFMLYLSAASVVEDRPMLWDTTTQTVSDKLLDPGDAKKWSSSVGPPEARRICLKPFQPKLGKVQRKDVDCRYTRLSHREGKVFRKRVCKGYPASTFITIITGKETADAYDLLQVTTVRDQSGKKVWKSRLRETGRRVGECPSGMPVEQ